MGTNQISDDIYFDKYSLQNIPTYKIGFKINVLYKELNTKTNETNQTNKMFYENIKSVTGLEQEVQGQNEERVFIVNSRPPGIFYAVN